MWALVTRSCRFRLPRGYSYVRSASSGLAEAGSLGRVTPFGTSFAPQTLFWKSPRFQKVVTNKHVVQAGKDRWNPWQIGISHLAVFHQHCHALEVQVGCWRHPSNPVSARSRAGKETNLKNDISRHQACRHIEVTVLGCLACQGH